MGWLMLIIAFVVGPVLVMGLMNLLLTALRPKRNAVDDSAFSVYLGAAAIILPAIAYEIFLAAHVFAWLTGAVASL